MDGFGSGYFVGRRKERRKNARDLAMQRDQMERELRARYGLPPLSSRPARVVPVTRPVTRITGRLVRRVLLAVLFVAVLFVAIFTVYAIGYGVHHHLIYRAG